MIGARFKKLLGTTSIGDQMGLRAYLLKRSINTVILILFIITLNFIIFQLMPGEQGAIANLVSNPQLRGENREEIIEDLYNLYGFNETMSVRYVKYVRNMLTFQFGVSFQTQKPIIDEVVGSGRLTNTIILIGVSSVIAVIVGVLIGVLVASRRGGSFDSFTVASSLTSSSFPTFWVGLLLILLFAFTLHWFPSGGVTPPTWVHGEPPFLEGLLVRLKHLFMPALTLTIFTYGGFVLLTRATMVEALTDDYVLTARAKGLPERTILFKHALKNASLPIVTNVALQFGFLLTGAIITETVFNWDGLGLWTFSAIGWKDFPILQAMFYLIAVSVVLANLVADVVYGLLDPRIRYE